MFELIDRKEKKRQAREILRDASVSAKSMTGLYLLLLLALNMMDSVFGGGILGTFVSVLTSLLGLVLGAGFVMYCMAIRRRERAEYLTLFDGFSFVGKIVCLWLVEAFFIFLWSMLFVIPGIVAAYRYSFAEFNLFENPGIGVMEALEMSKRQTVGYKTQLLLLDLSYLGWILLASLPLIVVNTLTYQQHLELLMSLPAGGVPNFNADPAAYLGIPLLAWTAIECLWSSVVAMFYLPNRVCVQLAYFETAQRTSGIPGNGQGTLFYDEEDWDDGSGPDSF